MLQNAANTDRFHKSVSKRTSLTSKQKFMLSSMVVGITVVMAVGTIIYILVNKESEKDSVTPTITYETIGTFHISTLTETTSSVTSAITEKQSTITPNTDTYTTAFVSFTEQAKTSVKDSTMEKTTSRSIPRTEDITSATSQDETTVSTSIIDTSSDKTSSVEITTSEVPSSIETTATLDKVPTPAYAPSSDGTSTSLTPTSVGKKTTFIETISTSYSAAATIYSDKPTSKFTSSTTLKDVTTTSNVITSGEITTTSNSFQPTNPTTVTPNLDIFCTDVSLLINSGAAVMTCSLNDTATFTMMNVTYRKKGDSDFQHIAIIDDSYNIVMLAMQDSVVISIFNYIINITILNPSCDNEGTFGIITNINSDSVEDQGTLTVQYPPGKPVLQLSVDQVIDLGFYRDTSVHSCTGLIGNPTKELVIEILYVNTTEYKEIPASVLKDLKRNKTTTECQNFEQIQFGLLFSSEMHDSKIRCRPSGNVNNDTIAEESLILIPRDICSCGETGSYRGHPGRCDSYVLCLAADMIIYPWSRVCIDGHCRNSLTGTCSLKCSDAVCNEDVPVDFCTTPAPLTTTSAPSPYIVCTDTVDLLNSGPAVITCYLSDTATFTIMNVTYIKSGESSVQQITLIDDSNSITMFAMADIVYISLMNNIINITISNTSCENEGTFAVVTVINGESVMDQGKLSVISPAGKPALTLNADQVIDLVFPDGNYYRGSTTHKCEGLIGKPPARLEIDITYDNGTSFQLIPNSSVDLYRIYTSNECSTIETV
ncbi:unnamed protein product [Mytilus coruscus]|uniref:Uncharacterized protein n=1 Tax=Mytilus coruscus TaxID=42192 RepID=A0A6J8C9Z2_MYTCO|nr:unnamed protein product [Mytilus coruscus]